MIIYQGSTYKIPIKLKLGEKTLTAKDVKKVEFAFGEVIKTYPENATFDGESFIVTLSQEDTFLLAAKATHHYQARIMYKDGSVKPTQKTPFTVIDSVSKEVLV